MASGNFYIKLALLVHQELRRERCVLTNFEVAPPMSQQLDLGTPEFQIDLSSSSMKLVQTLL